MDFKGSLNLEKENFNFIMYFKKLFSLQIN